MMTVVRGTFGSLVPGKPLVNVVAKNRGWLFEDLKEHFRVGAAMRLGVGIACSDEPWPAADAWIYLRTHEAASSPDPSRTVVQIHDMFSDDYGPGGPRRCVDQCGAVSLTHPGQLEILRANAIEPAATLTMPIGSPKSFAPQDPPTGPFTVGYVGRPMWYRGVDVKRASSAVAILALARADCVFVGPRFGQAAEQLRGAGLIVHDFERAETDEGYSFVCHSDYPGLYARMDALLVFSTTEAGPLCLFEALACGVPVVSTRVGWATTMIEDGKNGFLVDTMSEAVARLGQIRDEVELWRRQRRIISGTQPHRLERWIDANLRLALGLAR